MATTGRLLQQPSCRFALSENMRETVKMAMDDIYQFPPLEATKYTLGQMFRSRSICNGEITHINDFITYNLDIRQFVQDLLEQTDDHLLLLHFNEALLKVTILDPTCGSGAFLFAAMNILEPLYETCVYRMKEFNEQNPNLFKANLEELQSRYRSNIQYYIYKTIILHNLYGVDIMHEATEIAKLRLFLKMVAVVDVDFSADNLGLDPLPDIDFNIRCGNTLVGYATEKQLDDDLQYGDMFANLVLQTSNIIQRQEERSGSHIVRAFACICSQGRSKASNSSEALARNFYASKNLYIVQASFVQKAIIYKSTCAGMS